jgi:DNA-binding winged helix-turn-helix (wHTH) protein
MSDPVISFGPFRLLPTRQLLLDGDRPIRLGSRAREVLVALVERPGELVTKDQLIARVWPATFVEEANLRVHVAALRRVLGDGYVTNVPGRGYSFVAPISRTTPLEPLAASATDPQSQIKLPALLTRVIGRTDVVSAISAGLVKHPLITLIGSGGIGKTTVAVAVADRMAPSYPDGVRFIDFAPIAGPAPASSALASVIGIPIRSESPIPALRPF